jgi:SAM-dependent methyltransferase
MQMGQNPKRGPMTREMREKRAAMLAQELAHLPTRIGNPYFRELQQRWPVSPSLVAPVSQLCTASQFREPDYTRICAAMTVKPTLHRKQWELVYIVRCLELSGMIAPGHRGLVFGVGREKLPSLFISRGCEIVATDLPVEEGGGSSWVGSNEHSENLDSLLYNRLVSRETFYQNAVFRPVNMNAIPADLVDFDFCWSSCAFEHLGSLEHGLNFVRNSLKCLKPGGVAVHTTEFNLGSDTETLVDGRCVVYRACDLLSFAQELQAQGHHMQVNLNPGGEETDLLIDRDRLGDIHLRLYINNRILATSLGLFIRKAGPTC